MALPDILALRRAWQQYSKRLSKCAVGCASYVRRLQSFSVPPEPPSMHATMGTSVQLAQVASHVAAAVQEEYLASLEFMGLVSTCFTFVQKCRMK